MGDVYNTQEANRFSRANNSWWIDAHPNEVNADLEEEGMASEARQMLIEERENAAKFHQANKSREATVKRKAKGNGGCDKRPTKATCEGVSRSKSGGV